MKTSEPGIATLATLKVDEVSSNNGVNNCNEGNSKAIKTVNIESRKKFALKPCALKGNNSKLHMHQLA